MEDRRVPTLAWLRRELGTSVWVPVFFGIAFALSLIALLAILAPIGVGSFLSLQCLTFSADDYVTLFSRWQAEGVLVSYRAHLVLDDVHWLWCSVLATALLARVLEANAVSARWNFVLLLPLASGLLDWFENRVQHVFLDTEGFAAIVDPLPLVSAIASILKWFIGGSYVLVIGVLGAKTVVPNG